MAPTHIDEEMATEMLREGSSVRQVAERFGVSTQAVYLAIREGRVQRPERATASGGGRA